MTIEEKYLHWLRHPNMTDDLKKELESMDETAKNDAFYTDARAPTA